MPVSRGRKRNKKNPQPISKNKPPMPGSQPPTPSHKREVSITQKIYQGLIPSPEMMEHYSQIDPGLPGRLVGWVEQESAHRRKMESRIISHALISQIGGLVSGLIAVGTVAFLAWNFATMGFADQGMWIAIGVIASVATIFVIRKRPREQNNNKSH